MNEVLERYYKDERDNLVRKINNAAGSPENAEDVVQEAFARALKYWDSFDEDNGLLGEWFNTILKNSLRDFKRDEWLYGMCEDIDDHLLLIEDARDLTLYLTALIDKKGGEHKKILKLYYEKNYSPKDLANITEYKVKTIKQIIWRFKTDVIEKYGA